MTHDTEMMTIFFQQVSDLWVIPEIMRRQQEGLLSKDYHIDKVHILINGIDKPIVRLNKEVNAVLKCRLRAGIHKQVTGKPVYWKEIDDILDVQPAQEEDPDAAHVIMIHFRKGWVIKFDFRQYKAKAKMHYDVSKEFLHAARRALDEGHLRVFVDTLFSSAELLITSQLLTMSEAKYVLKPRHRKTHEKYNSFINAGNYKVEFKEAFNKLGGLRNRGRYLKHPFNLSVLEAQKLLKVVTELEMYTLKVIS